MRLKTGIWVQAQIRICDRRMLPVAVLARGDSDAGAVLVKLNRLDGTCAVFSQVAAPSGGRAFATATGEAPVSEQEADDYIARQRRYDPDLWVLEVEDPSGRYRPDADAEGALL